MREVIIRTEKNSYRWKPNFWQETLVFTFLGTTMAVGFSTILAIIWVGFELLLK